MIFIPIPAVIEKAPKRVCTPQTKSCNLIYQRGPLCLHCGIVGQPGILFSWDTSLQAGSEEIPFQQLPYCSLLMRHMWRCMDIHVSVPGCKGLCWQVLDFEMQTSTVDGSIQRACISLNCPIHTSHGNLDKYRVIRKHSGIFSIPAGSQGLSSIGFYSRRPPNIKFICCGKVSGDV